MADVSILNGIPFSEFGFEMPGVAHHRYRQTDRHEHTRPTLLPLLPIREATTEYAEEDLLPKSAVEVFKRLRPILCFI